MGSGRWQLFSGFVELIGGLVMTSSWITERQHLTGREKGEWVVGRLQNLSQEVSKSATGWSRQ